MALKQPGSRNSEHNQLHQNHSSSRSWQVASASNQPGSRNSGHSQTGKGRLARTRANAGSLESHKQGWFLMAVVLVRLRNSGMICCSHSVPRSRLEILKAGHP